MTRSVGVSSTKESTTEAADAGSMRSAQDVAKVAGRGTIFITLAKVWFMVTGYAIHFVLARLMSVENYGLYQVVIGVVSIINAVITIGTSQTVSKYVSQDEAAAGGVKRAALRLQVVVGGGASLGFCLLAPAVAAYMKDAQLTAYLRLA